MTPNRRAVLATTFGATAAATLPASARTTAAAACVTKTVSPRQPLAEIASGRIRGFEQDGVRIFLGIPYGAAVNGANRFQPPKPPEPWKGVRDTLMFGPECPWFPTPVKPVSAPEEPEGKFLLYRGWLPQTSSEDCLHLNVWAPAGAGKRPVMVYMHGGGYVAGSGHGLLCYDGTNLARSGDVVVVTHNHRLNALGYMDLTPFGGRWSQSVNIGQQDIVAVLRWVRDNIAALGGDPSNVTIFGQSGGGGKVLALMAMPSSRGLFHKAIVQSGTFPGLAITPSAAAETTARVFAALGIDRKTPEKLLDVKVEDMCVAAHAVPQSAWRPVVDGTVLPAMPGETATLAPGVPLLIGTNVNEVVNAVDNPLAADFDEAALAAAAATEYGAAAPAIVAAYAKELPGRTPFERYGAMRAADIRNEAFRVADNKHALDGKVWQYLFAWRTPVLEGRPKTFHSAEIAFAFANAGLCVNQTGGGPKALRLNDQISGAWVAMAHHGDPNHGGLPIWSAFGASHPTMVFDEPCAVRLDPEWQGRKLIAKLMK